MPRLLGWNVIHRGIKPLLQLRAERPTSHVVAASVKPINRPTRPVLFRVPLRRLPLVIQIPLQRLGRERRLGPPRRNRKLCGPKDSVQH